MNIIASSLLDLLDRSLGRENDPRIKLGAAVAKFDQTAAPTASERKRLKQLQTEWDASFTAANIRYTDSNARRDYIKQVAEHGQHARAGTLGTVRTRGLESLVSEYEAKQTSAKQECFRISADAMKVAAPVMERFIAAAERFLEEHEKPARAEAEYFELPYTQSSVAVALHSLLGRLRINLASAPNYHGNQKPADIIPFVKID